MKKSDDITKSTSMVDIVTDYLDSVKDKSCGKCAVCRVGKKRMLKQLEKITSGKGTLKDLDKLETIAMRIKYNSLCHELGHTEPNIVLYTLNHNREEYIAYIEDKKSVDNKGFRKRIRIHY